MAENNGIAKMPDYRTIVQKTGAAYIPLVEKQISNGGSVDLYQHLCMENALTMMHETAVGAGLDGISALQKSEIMQILQQVATLRLNAFSRPRECYFQTRKKKQPDGNWTTSIEMGIEGDGNDVILRNFGHGVEEVYPYWDVHVDDEFTYPVHHGIDVEPPTWKRCGTGKYARVVYPVRFTDGTVRYFISERAEVRANLVAHINNNMMNETFGIAESRYKATLQQKQQIDARKSELKALMDGKDIDEILDIPELKPYISPAWMEGSRERMILRKMRNNAVKPIPKDFANELSLSAYFAIPKSYPKKKAALCNQNILRPTCKPDMDNIAKTVADALNGVAYRDDSAIVELRVAKRYGSPERLVVRVSGDLEPEEEVVEGLHHG